MSAEVNQHGLSRAIPSATKRLIRQECFNGCVICGRLPYTYEHFAPPFTEAITHNPSGIVLLCPNCHADKTAKRLPPSRVQQARLTPFNRDRPAIWQVHLGDLPLTLQLGTNVAVGFNEARIDLNGDVLFGVKMPVNGDDWLFSGSLRDHEGKCTIHFKNNEVIVQNGVWDFELVGTKLIIRSALRVVTAQMSFNSESNIISIDKLQMSLDLRSGKKVAICDGELYLLCGSTRLLTVGGNKSTSTSDGRLNPLSLWL